MNQRFFHAMLCASWLLSGCGPAPTGPEMPAFDADAAADRALLELDKNPDGEIDSAEAKQCPAIAESFSLFDQDRSGKISKAELAARFDSYNTGHVALFNWSCQVTSAGRPVSGAQVTLVPESFLGEHFRPATGTTDQAGVAAPEIDPASLKGVGFGLYRISISKKDAAGSESVPEKYNAKTTLGQELAAGVRSAESTRTISISN